MQPGDLQYEAAVLSLPKKSMQWLCIDPARIGELEAGQSLSGLEISTI
jgi:hypothetical protein